MIPNAISNTGPYAGFWSHLKSIDHALARTLDIGDPRNLTELDKDRLKVLVDFLQDGLLSEPASAEELFARFSYSEPTEPDYSSAIDLRGQITSVPDFEEWLKASKESFRVKIQRLVRAIEELVQGASSHDSLPGFLRNDIPRKEFEILRAIVKTLLAQTETVLY